MAKKTSGTIKAPGWTIVADGSIWLSGRLVVPDVPVSRKEITDGAYYTEHYSACIRIKEYCASRPKVDDLPLDKICVLDSEGLELAIGKEEVLAAIASLGNDKALGSNGFPMEFYRKCWETILVGL